MKYIIIILLVLVGFGAKAQLPWNTTPTQYSTGYFRQGWNRADSAHILAVRDTNFIPRYAGTTILWQHAGVDTAQWIWSGASWVKNLTSFTATPTIWGAIGGTLSNQTDLQNALNLKLNISDTSNKWLNNIRRQPGSINVEIFKNGSWTTAYTDSVSSGGTGTVTSLGLSLPSAFNVTPSTITTSGVFNVTGAGTTAQLIRGNGTLITSDTGIIPNFYLKVRGLLSGTSPITFNQTTGLIGINNANTTGTKGAASFTSAFSDNGSGLIDLASIVSTGSCTNCSVTYNAKGQATAYSSGIAPSGSSVDTIFRTPGVDSIYYTINSVQYAIKDSTNPIITANNGLTKTSNNIQWGGTLVQNTTVDGGGSFISTFTATGGLTLRALNTSNGNAFYANTSGSGTAVTAQANTGNGLAASSVTQYGATATSTSNLGLYVSTTSGISAGAFEVNPSSTNTSQTILQLKRYSSGTAANGIAGRIEFITEPSAGTGDVTSGYIENGWEDATFATRKSHFSLWTTLNGTTARKANLSSTGQWTWDGYPALTAQNDTTTYKPVAIDGSGNVVKMAGWTGGGAVDSNRSIITSQEGILYSKSSWVNTSDFVNRGATASVVGTSIQLSSGANTFTQTLDLDTTVRERWVMHIEQRVGAVSSTSDGLGIGIRSVNPNYGPSIAGILVTNSTGNGGKLLLLDVTSGGSVIASSPNSISFSAGDTIVFELERDLFTFTMRGYNRTTGSITITTSYEYSVAPSPANVLPNTGTFSIFSVGGTQLMTNLSILSKETKHAPLMCIGDSKTVGYYSSNIGRYSSLAAYYFDNTITHAGSADRLDELLTTVDEIISIKPINATISIGSNDIGYGATVSQVFTNYKKYVSILQGAGVAVYHLLPFYQTTIVAELDSLADSIRAYYPSANIIDCRTPMRECPSCFLSGDNVHPNAAGDSLIVATIINSGFLRNYYKSPSLTSKPTLDIVLFNGNTSTREVKSGNIRINRTTAIADESLTVNGMGYFRKDQNANTYLVLQNATSGNLAATSNTFYNDNNDYLQEAIFSSSTTPAGDIVAGSTYTRSTSAAGHSIAVANGPLKFLFTTSNVEKARFNTSGELMLNSTTDLGSYTLQNSGGFYQNGTINLQPLTAPPSTYNVLVHGLTDSLVYQVPISAFSTGITTLNTLTASTQTFATGTSGSDFGIVSSSSTHTFNLPDAGTSTRGVVSVSSQTFHGQKTFENGVIIPYLTSGALVMSSNVSASVAPGISGIGLALQTYTYTDNGSARTEATAQNLNLIGAPIITSGNAITYSDNSSTFRITGAPIASGSMTLSHPWAMYANDVNFVQTLAMGLNEQSSSATLGNGSMVVYTGTGGHTFTLPALATHPGKVYFIKNAGSGSVTIARGGSDSIYDTSSVTSITVSAGSAVILGAGSSFWYVQ